jgi:hypothetical protein
MTVVNFAFNLKHLRDEEKLERQRAMVDIATRPGSTESTKRMRRKKIEDMLEAKSQLTARGSKSSSTFNFKEAEVTDAGDDGGNGERRSEH